MRVDGDEFGGSQLPVAILDDLFAAEMICYGLLLPNS